MKKKRLKIRYHQNIKLVFEIDSFYYHWFCPTKNVCLDVIKTKFHCITRWQSCHCSVMCLHRTMAAMKLSRELLPVPFFNVSNKHRILDLKKTLGTRNSAPGFSSQRIVSQKSYTRHQIRARHLAPYLLYCRIYKHQTHWQNIKRYTSTILLNIFNFKPPLSCLFIFSSS